MIATRLLRKLCQRHIVALCAGLATTMAVATEPQDDPLIATSACDDELSRNTARKLFAFVERQFDAYRNAKPLEVKVIEESWEDSPSLLR
jgi:hypothetical protein